MERRFQVSTHKLVPVQGFGFTPFYVDREMGRRFQLSTDGTNAMLYKSHEHLINNNQLLGRCRAK